MKACLHMLGVNIILFTMNIGIRYTHKKSCYYTLLKLQMNRQWYKSFVPLGSIKFTAHEWYK